MESKFPQISKAELTSAWMVKHFQVQNSTEPSDVRPALYRLKVGPRSLECDGEVKKLATKRKCSSITTSMEVEASDVCSKDFVGCEVGGLRGFVSKIFSRLTPVSSSPEYKKHCRSPRYISRHAAAAIGPHNTYVRSGVMDIIDSKANAGDDDRHSSAPSQARQNLVQSGSIQQSGTRVSPNRCSSSQNENKMVLMEIDEIPLDPFLTPEVRRKAPAAMGTKIRSLRNLYETLSLPTEMRVSPRVKRMQNCNKKLSHANDHSFENTTSSKPFILNTTTRRRQDTCSLPDLEAYQHVPSGSLLRRRSSSYSDLSRFERYSNTISSTGMEVFIEEIRKTFNTLKIGDGVHVDKVSVSRSDADLIDFDGTVPTRTYLKEAMSNLNRQTTGSDNQCMGKENLPSYETKKSTLRKRLKKYLQAASCSSPKDLGASHRHKQWSTGRSEGSDPNTQSSELRSTTLEDTNSYRFACNFSSQSHSWNDSTSDVTQEETSDIDLTEVSQLSSGWNERSLSILKSPQTKTCRKSVRFSFND